MIFCDNREKTEERDSLIELLFRIDNMDLLRGTTISDVHFGTSLSSLVEVFSLNRDRVQIMNGDFLDSDGV